ncbi:class I lanthipeptide [Lacinutrix neustonica]|uniref:Class I lanthipeptide n=1 Tax=Lacinutrix neustonica TaxID=2980107 RepID=A0A9E8MTG4_9FLAO|nr:class I lanthipeptide [Lacinutrix neustonica]WAC01031.1 class I lanthipeptide [Lacinutrix neustonica]
MKTQANKKLTFNKQNITELNDVSLYNIKGGGETSIAIQSHMPPIETTWLCLGNNLIMNNE